MVHNVTAPDRIGAKTAALRDRSGVRGLVLESFACAHDLPWVSGMRTNKYHLKKGRLFSAETCSKWSL